MIARLEGRVVEKGVDHLILDLDGVGYRVFASLSTLAALPAVGTATRLRIHTHVREDALELYGFDDPAEEMVFQALIAIPSIGCRKAMVILSGLSAEEIVAAVRTGDAARLAKAHGVGKKTAERLVLELKDRVAGFSVGGAPAAASPASSRTLDDLVSGLANLGYKADAARQVAQEVVDAAPDEELPALLRQALRKLKKG